MPEYLIVTMGDVKLQPNEPDIATTKELAAVKTPCVLVRVRQVILGLN